MAELHSHTALPAPTLPSLAKQIADCEVGSAAQFQIEGEA